MPLSPVQAPFYLHGADLREVNGMAFSPEAGKDCSIDVTFLGVGFPPGSELVVAPNWPNSMLLKDRMVEAMLEPAFDSIFVWVHRGALMLCLVALCVLFTLRVESPR